MNANTGNITLGPLDHIAPWNIPQSIIYLSLKRDISAKDAFGRLQEGLRRTLIQIPWLNGRVYWQSESSSGWRPGQLEIRYEVLPAGPPRQLQYKQLDTNMRFSDLNDLAFPLDAFEDKSLLREPLFDPDFDQGVEVLAAQANFLPGGCALVLSVAAPASDGTAMLSVTRIWADNCNSILDNAQQTVLSPPKGPNNGFSRSIFDGVCKERQLSGTIKNLSQEIYRLVGLDRMQNVSMDQTVKINFDEAAGMKPRLFYLPQSAYTALRRESASQVGAAEVSGNDLICALIWRTVARAWMAIQDRYTNDKLSETISECGIPFDARPDFTDLLPPNYLGNLNFEHRLAIPLSDLVADPGGIPTLASRIRMHATKFANCDSLLDAYALLSSIPDYRQLPQMRAPRMRPPSVGILSPMMLPFNESCFGAQTFGNNGRPEAFRPLMGACNSSFRTCFVIPRKPHGGVEFVMTLSQEEADFLSRDKEFSSIAFPMT